MKSKSPILMSLPILLLLFNGCATPIQPATAADGAVVKTPASSQAASATPAPKFGPQATRLYKDQAYVRKNRAPDFWSMMPYYLPQETGSSCSVASVAMVVNAARASQKLTASDELASHKRLLEQVKDAAWSKGAGDGGGGVNLDQLGALLGQSLSAYGLNGAKVSVLHVDQDSAVVRKKIRALLSRNEKSAHDFIVINFLQSEYTGDPEGAVGHIAPVAAYDAAKKRVLVFDPDRKYYEPYWVSEETLFKGMHTKDSGGAMFRGLVYVSLK